MPIEMRFLTMIMMLVICLWFGYGNGYEIASITSDMKNAADAIVSELLPPYGVTSHSSLAWQRLAYITDTFGPRFSGSENLENALDYIRDTARNDGLLVTEQWTMVPRWVRGEEWGRMLSPREKVLHMVGLGMSNSSQGKIISASVFVVSGYEDLHSGDNCSFAAGKIVLFNTKFTTYKDTVPTRVHAAVWAQDCGAVAALIRSITPFSLQNPHTGSSITAGIPAAAVSLEDASQMQRMQDRGQSVVVELKMESQFHPDSPSRNLLIDLVGSEKPHEFVLISGHSDSWDTTEGATDDGGGMIASWEALRVMKKLNLHPLRTIRAVLWVNEENGIAGALKYKEIGEQNNTLVNHSIAIESDFGVFSPLGLVLSCANQSNGGCGLAVAQLEELSPLLAPVGGNEVVEVPLDNNGADVRQICLSSGTVCGGWSTTDPRLEQRVSALNNPCTINNHGAWMAPEFEDEGITEKYAKSNNGYFWFHHSDADTMETVDPYQINQNTAALAIWSYAIANLPEMLPRNNPYPSSSSKNKSGNDIIVALYGSLCAIIFLTSAWFYAREKSSRSIASGTKRFMSDEEPNNI